MQTQFSNTLAQRIGIAMKSLTVRKVKTKRGSCTYDNFSICSIKISYIYQQSLLNMLSYMKHVTSREKNHSKNFWSLVEQYC